MSLRNKHAGSAFFDSLPDMDIWATMTQGEQANSVQEVAGAVNDLMTALIGPEAAAVFAPKPASEVLAGDTNTLPFSSTFIV
jgi:hypothetical protein